MFLEKRSFIVGVLLLGFFFLRSGGGGVGQIAVRTDHISGTRCCFQQKKHSGFY